MAEFASKGVAGSGLGLGIAGTALGLLNGGGLGGILGGNCGNMYGAYGCNENVPATRYDLGKEQKIAELETQIALRDASIYTDGKLNDLRNYVDRRFNGIEAQMCQQNVYNATNTAAIGCIQAQIAQLQGLTKVVIPNSSVCPGWGEVTTTITPAPAG
jgi:hypothetical protein